MNQQPLNQGMIAGYLDGQNLHHLDHLAPLCSLMNWPLVVTDETALIAAHHYYPDLNLHYLHPAKAPFEITALFDVVLTTLTKPFFNQIFYLAQQLARKSLKTIWLPHGHSDKGHLTRSFTALAQEDCILVYGKKMLELFSSYSACKLFIQIGNFRKVYAEKHQLFYHHLLQTHQLDHPFILYAPTWNDAESSSSFYEFIDAVSSLLDTKCSLAIKLHPNMEDDVMGETFPENPLSSIKWVKKFPPIYPLLEKSTHLIGDFSSIGYDFLTFNRPMFFLVPKNYRKNPKSCYLHEYGKTVSIRQIHELIEAINDPLHQQELTEKRQALYDDTFGPPLMWPYYAQKILTKVKLLVS